MGIGDLNDKGPEFPVPFLKGGKGMERIKKLSLKKIKDSLFYFFTFISKVFTGILSLKLIHIYLS